MDRKVKDFGRGYSLHLVSPDYDDNCYQIFHNGEPVGPWKWSHVETDDLDGSGKPVRVYRRGGKPTLDSLFGGAAYYYHTPAPDYAMTECFDYVEIYENGAYYLTLEGTVLTPSGPVAPDPEIPELPEGWTWEILAPFDDGDIWYYDDEADDMVFECGIAECCSDRCQENWYVINTGGRFCSYQTYENVRYSDDFRTDNLPWQDAVDFFTE